MLHNQGYAIKLSVKCFNCMNFVHVQGLTTVAVCPSCMNEVELPQASWKKWFFQRLVREVPSLPTGEEKRCQWESAGEEVVIACGNRLPRCEECKADVDPQRLAEYAASGGLNCECGAHIRVRSATKIATEIIPGARWVVNEGNTGGSDHKDSKTLSEPILFQCAACGAGLPVDGSERMVACGACGSSTYLPDGLWLRLHPVKTASTFFVVADPLPSAPSPRDLKKAEEAQEMARLEAIEMAHLDAIAAGEEFPPSPPARAPHPNKPSLLWRGLMLLLVVLCVCGGIGFTVITAILSSQ